MSQPQLVRLAKDTDTLQRIDALACEFSVLFGRSVGRGEIIHYALLAARPDDMARIATSLPRTETRGRKPKD